MLVNIEYCEYGAEKKLHYFTELVQWNVAKIFREKLSVWINALCSTYPMKGSDELKQ